MNGSLPDWFAERLSLLPATDTDTEAITWQLQSAWPWAPWFSVFAVTAGISWVLFCYSRESKSVGRGYRLLLAMLRIGALAILLLMLARFSLVFKRTAPPIIAVIVDRSASMELADNPNDSSSRLEFSKQLAVGEEAKLLHKLADNYQLRLFFADGGIENASKTLTEQVEATSQLRADGSDAQSSRLGEAVQHGLANLSGGTPAAMVLLTDGANTEGATLAQAAQLSRRKGVPLFLVGIGSEQPPRDVELTNLLVDDVVFVDDIIAFQATVKSQGLDGNTARVTLRRAGQAGVLSETVVELAVDGSSQSVRLTYRPTEPGNYDFEIAVDPIDDLIDGETDTTNNRQQRTVSVRDEKIRVLLAQSTPSYEFRYLKTLLHRDPTVELSTYLQEADLNYVGQDATALRSFPLGKEALKQFDVLILGDVDPRLLPRSVWPDVQSFVEEQGGGVVFIAGPRHMPWDYRDIAPVRLLMPIDVESTRRPTLGTSRSAGFTPQPTALGTRLAPLQLADTWTESENIWRNFPPSYWLAEVATPKPGAQVLLEHPFRMGNNTQRLPIACLHYFGSGRVLFHAIDSTWRWRFRVGDVFFARYWVQTVRFLARSKLNRQSGAELTTDRRQYDTGESVDIRLRLGNNRLATASNTPARVLLETAGQQRRQLSLTQNPTSPRDYSGTIPGLAPGSYRVVLLEPIVPDNPPSTQFSVTALPGEMAQPEMDRQAMNAAAETTFGKFYFAYSAASAAELADQLIADLPAGRRLPLEVLPALPLWNHWILMATLLGLLTTEWVLRRRKGLL